MFVENTSIVMQLLLFYRSRNRRASTRILARTLDNFTEPRTHATIPSSPNKGHRVGVRYITWKLLKSHRDDHKTGNKRREREKKKSRTVHTSYPESGTVKRHARDPDPRISRGSNPESRFSRRGVCVTHLGVISRVRIVVHSGSQPAVKTRGREPAEQEQKRSTDLPFPYTCPHKILRRGHVRDDNRGLASYVAAASLVSLCPSSSRFYNARRNFCGRLI